MLICAAKRMISDSGVAICNGKGQSQRSPFQLERRETSTVRLGCFSSYSKFSPDRVLCRATKDESDSRLNDEECEVRVSWYSFDSVFRILPYSEQGSTNTLLKKT